MTRNAIYQADLAYIHHVGFGDFAANSASGLLQILRRAGVRRGTLIDLGCGSGLWARAAQQAGFSVTGVDQSPAMIRLARRVAPASQFRCASLHDFALPACDAITAIGEGLNYLSSTGPTGPVDRLFQRVAGALRPGGVFIFDVVVRGDKQLHSRNWRSGADWTVLTEIDEARARRLLVRSIITFRKTGAHWRRGEETHRIRLFEPAEIRKALRKAGFITRITRRYGKVELLPRRLAFIARKPG